jgi:hypothetical protein
MTAVAVAEFCGILLKKETLPRDGRQTPGMVVVPLFKRLILLATLSLVVNFCINSPKQL